MSRFSVHASWLRWLSISCPERTWKKYITVVAWCCLTLIFLVTPSAIAGESQEESHSLPDTEAAGDVDNSSTFSIPPFLSLQRTPEYREFSLTPFYYEYESTDGAEKRSQFLWPLFLYKRSDQDVSIRVVPVYAYQRDVYTYRDSTEYDSYYLLFPIIVGGQSAEGGRYFALFPLYGRLIDFLGRDEIRFYLFPLYYEYSKDELHQRNYLWPVLSFSGGGDYSGFRIWPLYGNFEKRGEFRREFILWPFFHRQIFDLDHESPGRRLMIFPLYAKEDSTRRRYRAVLWPFFTHEENFARDFEEYAAPWPFFVRTRGSIYRTQMWPLYGYRETEEGYTRFILWPFWHRQEFSLDEDSKNTETRLLPFWSSRTELSTSGEVIRHRSRFWPLWRFRRTEEGITRLSMLSLLWFDDAEGFERHYSPLWTVYERETDPEGNGSTTALWGLYRKTRTAASSESRIPLVYSSIVDRENDVSETNFFGGLFGTSRAGDRQGVRFLYFINLPNRGTPD